jgi:UDP-N-acetyl-D-galactosamine dehydrogenase
MNELSGDSWSVKKICVVGLGYVGLPLAVSMARQFSVIGYDINQNRVSELISGEDATMEIPAPRLTQKNLEFTADPDAIQKANVYIVAVPTPLNAAKQPDLSALKGDLVIFESTVYPGCTEEVCAKILEQVSHLSLGVEFYVGYSPERINPGDPENSFESVVKVTAGLDDYTANLVDSLYQQVVVAGTFRAESVMVAETAKALENTQRDLNIALINETAIICQLLGIRSKDVLDAAASKWNFVKFTPGLVGGHCIGVDPVYLTYKAQTLGYSPEVILAGRKLNDSMGSYLARLVVKKLLGQGKNKNPLEVLTLGIAFKEDVGDFRNSKVVDTITELNDFGVKVTVVDPLCDQLKVFHEYGIQLADIEKLEGVFDAIILAVPHTYFLREWATIIEFLAPGGYVFDVKSVLPKTAGVVSL